MGNPILDSILNKYGGGGDNGLDNNSPSTDTQSGNPILDNILKEYSQPHIAPAPNLSMQGLREINNNIPDVTTPAGYNSPLLPGENPGTPAWFHNIATTLTTPLRAFMNLPFNQRASQAGAEVTTGQKFDNTPTTGSTIADTGASLLGGLMGFVANPEGSASNIGATTFNLGQEAAQKILPTALPNVLKAGAEIAAGSVANEGFNALSNNEPINAGDMAKTAGINTALGLIPYGIGKGLELRTNSKVDNLLPQLENTPLQDVQNAYKAPTLRDVNAQDYANLFSGPDTTFKPQTLKADNPSQYFGTTQADVQAAFPPRDINSYKFTTGEQRAMNDLTQGMQTAQNYIKHNDVLAAYPPGTSVDAAYADIKANTGVDIPKLADNLVQAQNAKTALTPEELRMGKVAGVIPDLKPRETLTPEPVTPTLEQPAQPNIFERKTWTNKDNIPSAGTPPIKSITPENVGQLPGGIKPGPGFGKASEANVTMEPKLQVAAAKIEKPAQTPDNYTLTQGSDTAPKLPQGKVETPTVESQNKYVDTAPIDINIGKNDKATSTDIRQAYVGKMNKQIVAGNQLSDAIQKLAPKEQTGIQLFIDSGGDMNHLKEMANSQSELMDKVIPNTKVTYRDAYNQALNLSPDAQKAAQMAQQYYKEAGQYANDMGSTRSVLDNYAARMWKQPPSGTVSTEVRKPGLNPYTSHSKERVFSTIGEGILAGKEPATLNAGDLLSVHNQEMARANTNRALAQSLQDHGLGTYQFEKPSAGFTAIDTLGRDIPTTHEGKPAIIHQSYVIPEGIAKGLKAITDPNYMAKVDALRHLQAYQGLVKTVDLSFSLFHHITLAAEALYNNHGGIDFIKNWDKMSKLGSSSFNESEKWGAQHGLMTTKIDDNYDVIRQLAGKESLVDKGWNSKNILAKGVAAPFKGAATIANKNTEFLFGNIQRWLKVTDFQNKAAEFVGKNPTMTNTEVTKGLRQIASQVNDAYGGLNWKAMGVTPSVLALSRLGLLAPDWTFSSARMLGRATGLGNIERGAGILQNTKNVLKGNPGNAAARSEFVIGAIGGAILTEGLNKLLTGHFTNQNQKSHELEVEVQPGVYISFFRSGIGDTAKWAANMLKQGPLGGTVNTIQGKMSPIAKTLVGQLSNKQPTGAPITNAKNTPMQNDLARLKSAAETVLPIPMGGPNILKYANSGVTTPQGYAFVGTGAGRYAKTADPSTLANPKTFYSGNWLDSLINPTDGANNALIDKISTQEKAQANNSKLANQALIKALSTGGSTANVFSQYSIPPNQQSTMLKDARSNVKIKQLSPLAQKYLGMSKANQKVFMNNLSSQERATLQNALKP